MYISKIWVSIGVISLTVVAAASSNQVAAIGELVQTGRLSEARLALTQSLKATPGDAELWNLLGIVNAQESKKSAAEEAFRKAVTLAPRLETAWLNLGRLYQMNNEKASVDKGVDAYQAVLRLNPQSAEAHHQLALLLEWKGAFKESLAHLNLLPPEDQRRRQALALRCVDEGALGNSQVAAALADELLRDPETSEADITAILPAIQSRNVEIAVRLLAGLEARGLASSVTQSHLATIYERQGQLKEARAAYEVIAQHSPGAAPPLLDLARIAWKQKDYEATLGYLAHARELEPRNAGIHFFFGVTCNEMKLPVEAKKSLELALKFEPENPYYNYAMGAVELQWLNKAQSIPYLSKFVSLRPSDARGHLALASAYYGLDQDEDAKRQLALALKEQQTRPGAEYLLGMIAIRQEDPESALKHFRQLLTLDPKAPEGHAEMASLLLDRRDWDGCRREIDLALGLEPDNYLANRILLRLYQLTGNPGVKTQVERLKALTENKEAGLHLLQRTIEVRPW